MEDHLKARFIVKKIKDIKQGHCNPIPTIICEMDHLDILELVRRNCLFSVMILFTSKQIHPLMEERLDTQKGAVDYGDLYILVNIN